MPILEKKCDTKKESYRMAHGFFKGTSVGQDSRFGDKEKKLISETKFAPELSRVLDLSKVKMETISPWITHRVTELMGGLFLLFLFNASCFRFVRCIFSLFERMRVGFEDEILVSFILNQLEEEMVFIISRPFPFPPVFYIPILWVLFSLFF